MDILKASALLYFLSKADVPVILGLAISQFYQKQSLSNTITYDWLSSKTNDRDHQQIVNEIGKLMLNKNFSIHRNNDETAVHITCLTLD